MTETRPTRITLGLCAAAGLLLGAATAAEIVIHVDVDADSPGSGESWNTAFPSLQDAIDQAEQITLSAPDADVQIWVAEGVYRPDIGASVQLGDQNAIFTPPSGIALHGGFTGTEGLLGEQDPALHKTIISGDLAENDIIGSFDQMTDNSHQLLVLTWNTLFDGFELSGGFVEADCGAGAALKIYLGGFGPSGVEISRCTFRHNRADFTGCADEMDGGAAVQINSTELVTFRECLFIDNFSSDMTDPDDLVYGGALGAFNSKVHLIDCTFRDNLVAGTNSWGGGVASTGGSLLMANCVFIGNEAENGGGFYTTGLFKMANTLLNGNIARSRGGGGYLGFIWDPRAIVNCTFTRNRAIVAGGGLYLLSPIPVAMGNSIIWQNGSVEAQGLDIQISAGQAPFDVRYSCVEGIAETQGNLNQDPLFFDPLGLDGELGTADDDLHLGVSSPCVDSGNSFYIPAWLTADLDGYPRLEGVDDAFAPDNGVGFPVVDMGVYEHPMAGDLTSNGWVDVGDIQCAILAKDWQEAGSIASPPSCLSQPAYADMNADGLIDDDDVSCVTDLALGEPPACAP